MNALSRMATFLGSVLGLTAGGASATEESLAGRVEPLYVRSEPQAISPGEPLSVRALVTHPPLVRGLVSWTVESRRHRGVLYSVSPSPAYLLAVRGSERRGKQRLIPHWPAAKRRANSLMAGFGRTSGTANK